MNRVVQHHPEPDELVEYATGALPTAQALCISTHLEFCKHCRLAVDKLEQLGGVLLEERHVVAVSGNALEQVWQAIEKVPGRSRTETVARPDPGLPRPLRGLLPAVWSELSWQWSGPLLRRYRLALGDPLREVGLLRMAPGGQIGEHDHRGLEWTVVLEGSFSDHNGLYVQGDYLRCEPGHVHRPVATVHRECICLLVHEGVIQFTGRRMKWINPFLRLRPK